MNKKLIKVVYSAVFAALASVATMIIQIPIDAVGYVNIGDAVVLLSAWLIGGIYGALAAGIGTALADLLTGYAHYVPGTFVIKFLMAFVAYFIFKFIKKKVVGLVISSIVAELIMIAGYFLYKALLLGKGFAAALISVPGNIMQAVVSIIIAIIVFFALDKSKVVDKIFKL